MVKLLNLSFIYLHHTTDIPYLCIGVCFIRTINKLDYNPNSSNYADRF